jgi:hypothetical protein
MAGADQRDATCRRIASECGRIERVDATGRNLNDRDALADDRLVHVVGGSELGAGDSPEPDVALRLHPLDARNDVVVLDDSRRRVVKVEHVQAVGAQAPQAAGNRGLECRGTEISRRLAVEWPDPTLDRQRRQNPWPAFEQSTMSCRRPANPWPSIRSLSPETYELAVSNNVTP